MMTTKLINKYKLNYNFSSVGLKKPQQEPSSFCAIFVMGVKVDFNIACFSKILFDKILPSTSFCY